MSMKIYVACLAAYNAGTLHGAWIDCEGKDADDLQEEVNAMLAASKEPGAEEFAIHDHEGFYELIDEYSTLKEVAAVVEIADELGDEFEAFTKYADSMYPGDPNLPTVAEFRVHYQGTWMSLVDYVEDFVEQSQLLAGVPEVVKQYFDYEAYARDLKLGGDIWTEEVDGGLAIFSG